MSHVCDMCRPDYAPARRTRGLTLPELMIGLAVVGVLSAVAVPGIGSYVQNGRIRGSTLDLVEAIALARSEAVTRRLPVTLCRTADPTAAVPSCGGTQYDWGSGFLVFVDQNGDGVYANGVDIQLRVGARTSGGLRIRTNDQGNNNLRFNADGTTNESGNTVIFALCDARGGEAGRQVRVPPVGRPWITQGSKAVPIDCQV